MLLSANQCPICEQAVTILEGHCPKCRSIVVFGSAWPAFDRTFVNESLVQQGIERARQQLKVDSQDGAAHYSLGLAYLNLGLSEQGVEELRRAADLLPEQHRISYEIACLYAAARETHSAAEYLRRALKLAPEQKDYRYLDQFLLAVAPLEQRRFREGVQHWIAAYRIDPDAPLARDALQKFVQTNEARLTQPATAKLPGLTPAQQEALSLLNGRAKAATQRLPGAPRAPRPLGKTSMRLLTKYAPARAAVLEQMYAARVNAHTVATEQYEYRRQALSTQNETAAALHEERLQRVRADLPLLAELCAMSVEIELQQQQEAERRRQEQEERRRQEQEKRQQAAAAKRAAATVTVAPPVKERQIYRTNATYVQGLPVGRKGDVVQLTVTNQRILLIRSAMLDKWTHEIPLSALTEAADDTVKGLLSKEPRLRLSYRDSQGMIAHALFTGLKVDACLKSILQARSGQ